ncbi:MAG: Sjogren's syndrome/scleroderma autoantigen 1 family protein [Candidatus Hodarchaeales archaeon]
MSRDEQIQEMSKLLLSGATLLSDSCPDCKVPLFRKGDAIFCSSCGRKAVYATSDDEAQQIVQATDLGKTLDDVRSVLHGKLEHLLTTLSQEEDLNAIKQLLEVIGTLLDLLRSLKDLK